jgi:hypothetical protein
MSGMAQASLRPAREHRRQQPSRLGAWWGAFVRRLTWGDRTLAKIGRPLVWLAAIGLWFGLPSEQLSIQVHLPQISLPWLGTWAKQSIYWYPTLGQVGAAVLVCLWVICAAAAASGEVYVLRRMTSDRRVRRDEEA